MSRQIFVLVSDHQVLDPQARATSARTARIETNEGFMGRRLPHAMDVLSGSERIQELCRKSTPALTPALSQR